MLLGFATWTLILLIATVGIYRWSWILTGRAQPKEFRADHVVGEDWYKFWLIAMVVVQQVGGA